MILIVGVKFDGATLYPALVNHRSICFVSGIYCNSVDIFVCVFQGQIMANLKAMDSDWFGQTYMGRKSKVKTAAGQLVAFALNGSIQCIWILATNWKSIMCVCRWELLPWRSSTCGEALCLWAIHSVPQAAGWWPQWHTGCRRREDSMDWWQLVRLEDR